MTLYERYNIGDDVNSPAWGPYWRAQTFTVGNTGINENHDVTSVNLKVSREGLPNIGTVAIYATSEGKPTGSALCSVDFDGNSLPTTPTWIEFIFTSPAILSTNTQYAIVLNVLGDVGDDYIEWRADSSSTYTGGTHAYSNDGGISWQLMDDWDGMFEEYGIGEGGVCSDYTTQTECETNGCYWCNGICQSAPCEGVDWMQYVPYVTIGIGVVALAVVLMQRRRLRGRKPS